MTYFNRLFLLIKELGGEVIYEESWGLRNLAYPINNSKKAFYEFMNIEIPGENIKTLNSKLNLNENVIRYLSVKVKEFGETPTAMLKEKE
jgi:small subunit ribosomal protein S6